MQVVSIDLDKNPEIKRWVSDRNPGDGMALFGTIKTLDDKTLQFTVMEAGEDRRDEDEEEADEMDEAPEDGM